MSAVPKVSVIVTVHRPGHTVDRLINSLDAQTLPDDDFEVIVVYAGPAGDTFDGLRRIAETRPNMQALRVGDGVNAGRARNIGIERARGEYLLVVDHDGSLFPDGLARAYGYAETLRADIVCPKEVRADDPWWGLVPQAAGNVANAVPERGVFRMMPMVARKLYRRQFLLNHGVRFPEHAASPWDGVFVDAAAYRHARVVSVLADTPMYSSHGDIGAADLDPLRSQYWDRLDELMDFLDTTLDVPACADARRELLAHQLRKHVLGGLSRARDAASLPSCATALRRARRLVRRYSSDDVLAFLPRKHRVQVHLLLSRRPDRAWQLRQLDQRLTAVIGVRSLRWREGVLHAELEFNSSPQTPGEPVLRRVGDRVLWDVGELTKAVPAQLLDVTDDADELIVRVCARARVAHTCWHVPVTVHRSGYETDGSGAVILAGAGEATIDPTHLAGGSVLEDDVWDFMARGDWLGTRTQVKLAYRGRVRPAVLSGHGMVAYRSTAGALTLDTAGRERTVALDAKPRLGLASPLDRLAIPLDNVSVFGDGGLDAGELVAVPEDGAAREPTPEQLERSASTRTLRLSIAIRPEGARLEGRATLPPGRYRIYARRGGQLRRTAYVVAVADGTLTFS